MPPGLAAHPLPRALSDRLGRFAREHRLTLGTLLTGAWAVVLGRYAGLDDLVFGVALPGAREALPARVRLDWDRPVSGWLAQLQEEQALARGYGSPPLDRPQEWSEIPAGRRLFDSVLVIDDDPAVSVPHPDHPLTLLVQPRRRLVEALFDPAVLDPDAVRPLLGHLANVLEGFLAGPALGEVALIGPAERAELVGRSAARASFPIAAADLVPARFAGWAKRDPSRVAVSYQDQQVSYQELSALVARLAHRLRGLGVGPGTLVGICLPRGVDLVVAVLAVACAGGGYVPVDRRDPVARVRTILDDASVAVLLTHRDLAVELGAAAPTTVCLDEPVAGPSDPLPPLDAGPSDIAYVIYTSGSTGSPKGVVVEHAQLARLFDATHDWFGFGPDDVWTLFHSIAFDFSVWELWGALAHGGRLVVVPDEITRDPTRFRGLLLAEGVTVLNQTPSAFRTLMHADLPEDPTPYRLRWVIFGGERLEVSSLRPWLERHGDQHPRLANMYGITETTVHVTYRPISHGDLAAGVPSPIGEPIPDLAVRLVDPRGALVPVGVPGEMQVSGAGVARGYLNRPELTADRFVTGPDRVRWYRTGDLARWLPEGGLEFLGRLDNQVKVRGHRIEPGEVESVLNGHPQVRESVVVARETGPDGHRQLVAFLVPEPGSGLTWSAVRNWLSQRLPDHLVPAGAVSLDRLPLTPNGKLDRAALPAPHPARPGGDEPVVPRTGIERVLVEVMAEVLERERVGIADNFFELGGDSILTIQVASRARQRGVAVTPAQVFTHQTVAELATVADRAAGPVSEAAAATGQPLAKVDQRQLDLLVDEHGPLDDIYPLAPLQRGLLFHTLANPHSGVYFEQFSIPLEGALDVNAFTRAWTVLHERHAVLRAAIAWQGLEVPHLVVRERVELPLTTHDWRHGAPAQQAAQLAELLAQDRVQGFDLSEAPLTRLHLIRLAERQWQLAWSHHHILLDRWSVALLIQEIFDSYEAIRTGQYRPAPPPRPYRDYLAYLAKLDLTRAPAYWRRVLAGVTRPTPLGEDRPAGRTGRRDEDYARVGRRLPPGRSEAVRQFVRTHRLTLDTVLHGAWALLLARRSGLEDVVFGVTSSGRPPELAGVEDMVGLFINTLPARVRVNRDQPVASWLTGLMQDQVEARELEYTPLDQIRSWSVVPADQPLFESGRALVNFPWDSSRSRTGNLTVGEIQTFEQASHAITFVAVPEQALHLQLWYDARRFSAETADHMVRAVEVLVRELVADPDRPVGEVLARIPAPAAPAAPPHEASLPELVGYWAARAPARVAVSGEGATLTYQQLDQRADQLAVRLREAGAGPGTRVGVAVPRTDDQVVAALGILKAGAVYIPLPAGGPERLDPSLRPSLCVSADGVSGWQATPSTVAGVPPADPAMVVWWQGPDGLVSGAMLSDAELARRARSRPGEITDRDVIGQHAEPGSEVAAWEIWAALANGAGLAWGWPREQAATVVTLAVPAVAELLDHRPSMLDGVRLLLVRGELPAPYARRLRVTHPDLRVAPAADLETGRIASRLRELPMVSEAVVTPAPDGRRLTAYLLPAAAALDGDAGEVARRHVEGWRAGSGPAGERSDLVERIRALEPDQILEIGWGRGPSLPGLRAWCDSYLERRPDDLSGLAAERFDVVVLHSVVPSFPGAAYLARVLDAAIRVAAPHGAVVLGGLRHHGLREAYHTSVELSRAVDMLPIDELRRRVRHALAHDPELSVDPRYFTGYAAGRPEIGAVEVMPARGRDDTTLTQYRYDVVLRLGTPPPEPETEWHDWRRDVLSRDEIEWLLDHAGGNAVGVCGIPDQRVAMDVKAARLLAGADPPGTAGRLRSAAGPAASGMDPEELSQLAGRKGWSVAVTWSAYRADGSLHARFCRTPELAAGVALATAGDEDPPPVTLGPLTSTPLRPALVEELERLAAGVLPETVPEYAGVTRVVVVDELPRAASGRVDETALPVVADEPAGPATAGPVPPRTADELRLARIWEEVLGVTSVDVRTSFFDLGGDSMLAIRLIDEATRALGRELPLAVLLQQPTIEGMAAALSARPGPWTPLVEINPGPGTPFFCVHPAGGNVICYAELARLVRPQPFYALQARGVEGDDPPHDDIPAMATRYLQDVRARQPTGPYLLGGWSMGGLIAYEMAHQLAAAGEPVGMVVMVDTPTPDLAAELPDQAAALARLLDGVVPVDLTQLRAMPARERLRFVLAEAERAHVIPPGMDPDRAQHLFEVFAAHLRAVDSYRPRPYGGPVRLLRATHSGIDVPDYGWGRLLGGQWEVIEVPGNHDTVVWPPNVQRVAEVLRAQLR